MDLKEITKMYNFENKTTVITGGTGVLGREIACALIGCGSNVAIIDRNPNLDPDTVQKIDTTIGNYIIVAGDIMDRSKMNEAAEKIYDAFGNVDFLINAAGGNHPDSTTNKQKLFFDIPEEAFRFTMDLNLLGTVLACQVFGKKMAELKRGNILNISSMSAFSPLTRVPAYSASKAAISNFTQWLAVYMAQEFSPDIRVNAIAPGFFLTEQNRFLLTDKETKKLTERGQSIISHTPMGRFGDPEDLLGTVLWLLSPASAFITGIVVPVDGGFSAFGGV